MAVYTSYFGKYKGANGVSIVRGRPSKFSGEQYLELAPPWSLIEGYKSGVYSKEDYTKKYIATVLNKLDPEKVYNDLDGKVLLCYERSEDFCHRHIISKWLNDNGFESFELK